MIAISDQNKNYLAPGRSIQLDTRGKKDYTSLYCQGDRMRILIVDDSHIIRDAIENWLKEFNLEIIGKTYNGKDAVEIVREARPELVTLDITMPEMDGLTALEKILETAPETKVIIISALSSKDIALCALRKGAISYIVKPFTEEELKEVFREVIGG
jgi:two-component system chemotaxis response regulator CheY